MVCFRRKQDYENFNFDFVVDELSHITNFLEQKVEDKYYYDSRCKIWDAIEKSVRKNVSCGTVYQYRRYYVRENKTGVCPTLTANMGSGGHNVPLIRDDHGIRKLTPRECFNLQGFPAQFKLPELNDNTLYKLAGNAVTIPIIQKIFEKLLVRDV